MIIGLKYIVLLSCVELLDAMKYSCYYNFYKVGFMKYFEIPLNWYDAALFCRLQGGELASPTNDDMRAAMVNLTTKGDVYTGFQAWFATFDKRQYISLDGTRLSDIPHKWAESEPDRKDGLGTCLTLNPDGTISDVNCYDLRPFICYRKNSTVEVNECGNLDPEYEFDNRTNKCYKLHMRPKDLDKAHSTCFVEGGHLATENTEEESKVMSEILARHKSKNISDLRRIDKEGYDDIGEKYCAFLTPEGLVNDYIFCDYIYSFICKKEPNSPSFCDNGHLYNIITENRRNRSKLP